MVMGTGAEASPRSPTEMRLTEIWLEVLNLNVIGVDEEFLELDGDSLSAMLCISRISNEFDVTFELEDFFLQPATVASFAARIDRFKQQECDPKITDPLR
jgi:acyl carrier protein